MALGTTLHAGINEPMLMYVEWLLEKLNEIEEQKFPKTSNSWEVDTR